MSYRADPRLPALRLARRRGAAAGATRFADHSRETFDAVLDTCERIAREKFAPLQPHCRHRGAALRRREGAPAEASARRARGLRRVRHARAPRRTTRSAACSCPTSSRWRRNSFFSKAGIGIGGGGMLTSGNANLLMAHGTAAAAGGVREATSSPAASRAPCACREPQAGSCLSDIATRAVPDGADFEERSARPALPPDAATRCGSRPASTS